ncbi:MAG: hypothetical protein OXC28_07285 [Defluviicoccus sp.]|nr:hypothetical protein [Defluviicoccus sp.]
MNPRWTDGEIRTLAALLAAGESYAGIAAALGRTRNAVSGAVCRRGLRQRPAARSPAPPAAPAPARDPGAPPWRCLTPGCGGTRQPGRERCAGCITAAAVAR